MNSIINYMMEVRDRIDTALNTYISSNEKLLAGLYDSIRYSLFSGGKRTRPIFCIMVGEIFGVAEELCMSTACAIEMIHTSSLIMDDLPHMDNAQTRRGRPANHTIYGQDVAALASIGLLTKAYEIVLADAGLTPDIKNMVIAKLARSVGIEGMVGGQFVDLKYTGSSMARSTLEYIHTYKTASLFVASGSTAAVIGNASLAETAALESYASHLGMAFQILDDLLDACGTEEDVKKTTGHDKANFVSLYGIEGARSHVEDHTSKALEEISIFSGRNEKLIALARLLLARTS